MDLMKQTKLTKSKQKSTLEMWAADGVACSDAKFHQPVPPAKDKEPVSQFMVRPPNTQHGVKYTVDSIIYTPHGVIYTAFGETNIVALANVVVVRAIVE